MVPSLLALHVLIPIDALFGVEFVQTAYRHQEVYRVALLPLTNTPVVALHCRGFQLKAASRNNSGLIWCYRSGGIGVAEALLAALCVTGAKSIVQGM